MLWDVDLIFGMWVYNDKLQIKFTFRSDPMIFGRVMALGLWNLAKYLVVITLLTWFLVYECIAMSYRSSLLFVPVQWFLAELWLKFGQIFSCRHFISLIWDIDLIFGMSVYNHMLQINFEIHSGWMIFDQLAAVGLWNLAKYLVVATFFSLWFEILTWFLLCACIVMSYRSSLNFVPIEWFWANLLTLYF